MKTTILKIVYTMAERLGSNDGNSFELFVGISCLSAFLASLFGFLTPAAFFFGYMSAMIMMEVRYNTGHNQAADYIEEAFFGFLSISLFATASGALLELVFALLTGGHWNFFGRLEFPYSWLVYMPVCSALGAALSCLLSPSFLEELRLRFFPNDLAPTVVGGEPAAGTGTDSKTNSNGA